MIIYPICITKQIGSLAQLHINSYGYGHDTLYWYKAHDKSRMFHVKLSGADVIISGFKESAEYTFFTMSSKNKVSSATHTSYFNCDPPRSHLKKLKEYTANYDDPDYVDELISRIADVLENQESTITNNDSIEIDKTFYVTPAVHDIVTPIELLKQEWSKTKDPQEYEYSAYAKIYQIFERYCMLKCKAINKDHGIDFDIEGLFSPVLRPGYQITRFDVYIKEGSEWRKTNIINVNTDTVNVGYDFATLYRIRAYAKSELAYEFIHYQPDESLYSYLWNMSPQHYDETIIADITLDHEDIDMSATEIQWYNDETRLGAADWIAVRPQFSHVSDYTLYFYIPNFSLLHAFGKKFYLAAQETDLAYGMDYQCLKEITGDYVGINYANYYLGGDIFFYVVDDNIKPVSKVTRFSFDSDLEDYQEKVHQLEVKTYCKRLENIMQVRFPKAIPEIDAYCSVLSTTPNGYTEILWRDMLSRMNMSQGDSISRPKVFFGILEEHLSNFTLDRDFFLDDVSFYHATSVFTFPRIKDRNYVLAVCSFDKYSGSIEEYYYPSFNSSIEIQVSTHDYTIMYAIDKDTYRRSGFIIACREKGYTTVYNKDIDVIHDNRLYIEGRG